MILSRRLPTRRLPTRQLLLCGLLALTACGQPASVPQGTLPPAPSPVRPLTSAGTFVLSVSGATTASPTASVRPASGMRAQEASGLKFEFLSSGTLTDEQRQVRYLRASFRVTNVGGPSLSAPAYIPLDTEGPGGTVGTTPFANVQYFDGTDASALAPELTPDTARQLTYPAPDAPAFAPDPAATPLKPDLDTGAVQVALPAGQQLAGTAHQGWVAGALPSGGSQIVTFAASLPMAATPVQDPFAFDLVFSVADNPGTSTLDNIAAVQGQTPAGDAPSPRAGGTVTVEGVVTAVYTANVPGSLKGFFMQEEGIDADADAATSNGLFVYCNVDCPAVVPGDRVRVRGTVSEFFTATQVTAGSADITRLNTGLALPPAQTVTLPLPVGERERSEGMRLSVSGVVTNNFPLGRGDSFDIADARIPTFTQVNRPSVEGLAAYQAQTADRFLRIDDGSRAQNPGPIIFARNGQPLSAENTLRGGDHVNVTGVLTYSNDGWTGSGSLDTYRLHTDHADITGPERPAVPGAVGGGLRVGSMNVLNYFTTLVSSNEGCTLGGTGGSAARGANNCAEFERQRAKIVQAITKLNPAVLGLLEIQNDFDRGTNSSIANLVGALNGAAAPGTYAYIDPGARVGTDAISVAMIYQPAAVTPVGSLAILDSRYDPAYIDTANRLTLAQTFQSRANGGRFTAVMAHLKSKGSACAGDPDLGDGQGNCNRTRTTAAQVITRWLESNPTGVVEPDRIILGDLNAYRMEDPILAFGRGADGTAGSADDLVNLFGPESYSYQFDGQWGSLDHALVSGSLQAQVTGQTKWHINADEPTVLDYNLEFKSGGQQASLYAPTPFRSSDHDPILVGLNLAAQTPIEPPAPVASVTLTPETASLTLTADGSSRAQSFTASGTNTSGDLTVSVTPQNGAPSIVTAPATVSSGAAFDVTVTAPSGTVPGSYTYQVKAASGDVSDTGTLTVTVQAPSTGGAALPWINEFHYDNAGTDVNEFVEVVVPATFNAANLKVYLYNGSPSQLKLYGATTGYALTAAGTSGTYGFYTVTIPAGTGLQNGNTTSNEPDGIAICDGAALIEFISYEGSFMPTDGCAAGGASVNVGVVEDGTANGTSVQRKGTGNKGSDFTWSVETPTSAGTVNAGQTLN